MEKAYEGELRDKNDQTKDLVLQCLWNLKENRILAWAMEWTMTPFIKQIKFEMNIFWKGDMNNCVLEILSLMYLISPLRNGA